MSNMVAIPLSEGKSLIAVILLLTGMLGVGITSGLIGSGCENRQAIYYNNNITVGESGSIEVSVDVPPLGERNAAAFVRVKDADDDKRFMSQWSNLAGTLPRSDKPDLSATARIEPENIPFEVSSGDRLQVLYVGDALEVPLRCQQFTEKYLVDRVIS